MRLTLRTLLAHMDGVLEPADSEKIEEKIQESEFASGIVNRVRDVVRQLRLGAPRLRGKGMGLDPNTVAEYLDNTLPTEQVPDFEKVCLESDKHLAEVAACHQVLTLVLGEPAEVTPDSRERMYALIHQDKEPEPEAVEEISGNGSPAAVEEPVHVEDRPKPHRQKRHVPDYLREPSGRRMWPVAAALLLLTMLVCVAVLAVGPQNLIALLRGEASPEVVSVNEPASPVKLPTVGEPENGAENVAPVVDIEPEPATDEPVEEETEPAPLEDETTAEPPVPEAMPEVSPPDTETSTEAELPLTDDEQPEMSEPPVAGVDEKPVEPAQPATDTASVVDAERTGTKKSSQLARFVSDRTVLLKFDVESSTWVRLPSRSAIGPGDQLLAMPAFDATLTLGSGINLDLMGGTLVEFGPSDANDTPQLMIHYGRVVLMTSGGAPADIHIIADGQQGWLGLTGQDSIAAFESVRLPSPESDPEADFAPLAVRLFVGRGDVTWRTSQDAQPRAFTAPFQYTLGNDDGIGDQPPPEWMVEDTTPLIEQRAAEFIEQELAEDREISLRAILKELAEHRRSEVKALAARCLTHMEIYDPVINALDNPLQYAAWPALATELSLAIARSPQEAAAIREAFERERGDEGTKLYRLLRGYSTQQLRDGAAEELVAGLDNEAVDIRVLSFWNLHKITGEMNAYRADHTAARRKPKVQKWREQLEAGKIVSWDEDNDDEGQADESD